MGVNLEVFGKTIKLKGLVQWYIRMVMNMLEIIKIQKSMVLEHIIFQIEINMKGNL